MIYLFYEFRSQRPQFRPQWMSPEEFADKNHPKWEEYRRRISIAERVSLIHRDWGAGNTIDLTRNLTKHQFSKIQNRHIQSMFHNKKSQSSSYFNYAHNFLLTAATETLASIFLMEKHTL